MTGEDYVIIHGPLAGIGPSMYESVPFSVVFGTAIDFHIRDDSDVAARARGDADYPTSLSRYSR